MPRTKGYSKQSIANYEKAQLSKRQKDCIKHAINDSGLTITDIANLLGMDRNTVSRWINHPERMDIWKAHQLNQVLGGSIEWVL